jgi:hypothetical protein
VIRGRRANRQRRLLGRAVSEAEFAVLGAQVIGAPTGELDTLCYRLRLAAQGADHEIGDLLTAARMIREAAATAVASLSGPAGRPARVPGQCEAIDALIESYLRRSSRP